MHCELLDRIPHVQAPCGNGEGEGNSLVSVGRRGPADGLLDLAPLFLSSFLVNSQQEDPCPTRQASNVCDPPNSKHS